MLMSAAKPSIDPYKKLSFGFWMFHRLFPRYYVITQSLGLRLVFLTWTCLNSKIAFLSSCTTKSKADVFIMTLKLYLFSLINVFFFHFWPWKVYLSFSLLQQHFLNWQQMDMMLQNKLQPVFIMYIKTEFVTTRTAWISGNASVFLLIN